MFWLDFFKGQYTVTPEEKFTFDLEGYLVIKDVLSREELDNLNAIADREFPRDYDDEAADSEFGNSRGVRRAPSVIDWDIACRHLLDHPKVLPYLTELLGPKFRLDHDYAIFMIKGGKRGSVHGGNPSLFHHPNLFRGHARALPHHPEVRGWLGARRGLERRRSRGWRGACGADPQRDVSHGTRGIIRWTAGSARIPNAGERAC